MSYFTFKFAQNLQLAYSFECKNSLEGKFIISMNPYMKRLNKHLIVEFMQSGGDREMYNIVKARPELKKIYFVCAKADHLSIIFGQN
jgi:hypothetical protein